MSFPSIIVDLNGECPGVKHQDSQFSVCSMFKFATAPSVIVPCLRFLWLGVINDALIVHAANAASGSIPHLCTIHDAAKGRLNT